MRIKKKAEKENRGKENNTSNYNDTHDMKRE